MALKQIAKGLGWFSIGLGLSQLLLARQVGEATGVGDPRLAMNAIGLRELGAGALILGLGRNKFGVWSRVLGDTMDLALLANAYRSSRKKHQARILGAASIVGAITMLDLMTAMQMNPD